MIVLATGALPALGQAVITGEESRLDLSPAARLVSTGTENKSFATVRTWPDSLYRSLKNNRENMGFTRGHHWLKFRLQYQGDTRRTYFLRTARPITDSLVLYQMSGDGTLKRFYTGDQVRQPTRQNKLRSSVFKIELEPGKTYQYYLHLYSDGEMLALPLTLSSALAFAKSEAQTQLFHGVFYGMVLLAALVYLIFYRAMRDRSFLFYGFYVLSIGLLQLSLDGYMRSFWFFEGGWLASRVVLLTAYLSIVFLGLYSETFLRLREHLPRMKWAFRGIYGLATVLVLLMMSGPAGLATTYPLINVLGLILLGLIFASVVLLRRRNKEVDTFYTVGVSFLVFTLVVFILNNIGILPHNFLTVHSSKIGATLEVVFLSISMTNRIRRLKNEKEHSQQLALERSQQMNDVKSYFMSNMSHELRTPLNAILGLTNQMLEGEMSSKEFSQNLEVIKYSSKNLLSSVNDILDFSKMEKGEIQLVSREFDPQKTLAPIFANWETIACQKGLAFLVEGEEALPKTAIGDPDRLQQVLNNLLSNAVKFTSSGSVKTQLSCEASGESKVLLKLKVSDTGIGIKKEKQKQIFEHFWQNSLSHKRQFGGLGLGLSIVNELVNRQGGKVELDSEVDRGTSIRATVSLKAVAEAAPAQSIDLHHKTLDESKLLIVEDNALNQLVLKKMLDKWEGTSYAVAENGQVALEKLQAEPFDLILMDLQMPVMDGYEATERIKKGEAGKRQAQIPIVAVTADVTEETRQKVLKLGMADYLSKPVSNDDLYRAVALLLNENHRDVA